MKHILSILSGLSMIAFSGQALSQTYNSSAPVTVISSDDCPGLGAPSSSVINVTGPGTINTPSDVFININMTSGCLATARIVLVAPNGDSCILLNMPYRSGSCAGMCYETNPSNTLTFNATNTTQIPATDPVPAGNYMPLPGVFMLPKQAT
ncbi:MAG: hypothetical protein EOP54_07495 [Sphingobacteriales bacterium]|nr:MAG: hypothetical protein EOP54_07495 [Sphingobacteriales bacterium]